MSSWAIPACLIHSFTSDLCLENFSDMQPNKMFAVKSFNF